VCYCNPTTQQLYTATLGDSEANIYRKIDGIFKSLPLSPLRDWETDEKKVENQLNENYFIQKLPNKASRLHSVITGSNTNVSRSIGDLGFPMVSQKPKVTVTTLCPEDILVLCSDGLKNSLKEGEIMGLVAKNEQNSSKELANVLIEESLEKQKTTKRDNVTAMVVKVTEKK
jgi:serine/threonine protein phosphatase PrpC